MITLWDILLSCVKNDPKSSQQCSNPEKSVLLLKVMVVFIWLLGAITTGSESERKEVNKWDYT